MIKKIINKTLYLLKKNRRKKRVIEYTNYYKLLDEISFVQEKHKNKNILFVIPYVEKYSGGLTSIFRLSTELANLGYNVYYYSICESQSIDSMIESLKINFPNYKGKIVDKTNSIIKSSDKIVCATAFNTAIHAAGIPGYKVYFVQDYEPFFFPKGDLYFIAQETYNLGYHIISLGNWNIKQISLYNQENFKGKMDFIDFPFEPKEYKLVFKDYNKFVEKRKLSFAVYSRSSSERRMPSIELYLVGKIRDFFAAKSINVDFYFFGDDLKYPCVNNLGKLKKEDMNKLFEMCDFGMCMSATNVSLVPYEMMAKGLIIVDFGGSSLEKFISKDCFVRYENDSDRLCNYIYELMKSPQKMFEIDSKVKETIKSLSWEKSSKQFYDIIENIRTQNEN